VVNSHHPQGSGISSLFDGLDSRKPPASRSAATTASKLLKAELLLSKVGFRQLKERKMTVKYHRIPPPDLGQSSNSTPLPQHFSTPPSSALETFRVDKHTQAMPLYQKGAEKTRKRRQRRPDKLNVIPFIAATARSRTQQRYPIGCRTTCKGRLVGQKAKTAERI
jgi:hypothetical protein